MEFQTLKQSHLKRNIIIGVLVVGIISVVVLNFTRAKYRTTESIPLVTGTINYSLGDLIIEEIWVKENESYKEKEEIPNGGYELNKEKSYCMAKGQTEEIELNYNVRTKSLTMSNFVNKGTKCYLYFDVAWEGNGTKENPYKIETIEDLIALSNAVNSGITYEDNYFRLENNLDFQNNESYVDSTSTSYGDINGNEQIEELKTELTSGSGFTPIGNSTANDKTRYFSGTMDGNNKKISNLYIYNEVVDKAYLGLFGYVMNATIKNLGVSGTLQTNISSDLGGIIGRGYNIVIENCYNETNITSNVGSYSIGGIVGWTQGTTTIKNSHNKGNLSNGNNTGGLVGGNEEILTIENSHNEGIITNNLGHNIGGILGRDNAETNITTINDSYNNGKVSTKVIEAYDNLISIGGLIGYIKGQSIINRSYNTGEIENGLRVGGILGFLRVKGKVIINESYNTGSVSSISNDSSESVYRTVVGGLIGYNHNSEAIILNSYNTGEINSIKQAAGIVGLINNESTSKIINSYNAGDVTSSGIYVVAGITLVYFDDDRVNHLYLNNAYNIGSITSNNNTYGIASIVNGNIYDISNTYYLDNVSGSNNTSINLTEMSSSEMKSNDFVTTLNNNITNINLSEIDESLSGYQLLNWKLGENGYPVLK